MWSGDPGICPRVGSRTWREEMIWFAMIRVIMVIMVIRVIMIEGYDLMCDDKMT